MKKTLLFTIFKSEFLFLLLMLFAGQKATAQTSLEWAANIGIDDEVEVVDSYYDPVSDLVYLVGTYSGSDFPATIGSSISQDRDAFIIALNSDGTGIVWSRLYGGSGHDYGYGIYTDAAGDVFIQGRTRSSDLPTNGTTAAFLATNSTDIEGFIARFGSSGTVLKYGTYVPGDHTAVKGMAVSGDNVYLPLRVYEDIATVYPANGFVSPNFERGMGVYNINTSVGGSAGLEGLAHYGGNFYYTESRRVIIDNNGYIYIMVELDDFPYLTDVYDADFFTPDAAQNSADLLDGFNNLSVADASLPILAIFSPDLSSLDYATAFYPVKGISLGYESKPAVAVDDAGNIYLYSTPDIYDYAGESTPIVSSQIQQFNNLSGITIPSVGDYEFSMLAKIAASDRSKYEWVNLFSGNSNNGNNSADLEVDSKSRIHIAYPDGLNGGDTRLVTSNKLFAPSTAYQGNTMYTIFSPTGAVEFSTPIQPNGGEIFTITLDKEECKAYINTRDFDENSTIVTPTYYDEKTGMQITVDNADPATPIGNGILVFHSPTPNNNTITDFPVGEDEFCVGSYIYQNPNDGPIIGADITYESGDGSSATQNLTDYYYAGALTSQTAPSGAGYQWQVSRNSGSTWEDIDGENLSVLKPESETAAGTVQYRRLTLGSCCDTTFSNVITATILGAFNLEIATPADPVYYCEGTAEPIPITVSGASGNISWQWYNGFTPLTNAEINPASGNDIVPGSFTAEIASTQTAEGFYRLIITDASGCKKEASITFLKLTADAINGGGATMALCPGTTPEVTLGPATVNPLFDYSWTGPGGFTSTAPNPTVTVAGAYSLQVKLTTDIAFCAGGATSVTVSGEVAHDAALIAIDDIGFCQPDSPAPIGLSGTAPADYVFQWSPGLNLDNQTAYSPNFDPGILPFGAKPIDSVTYTFTALRTTDGCIFEETVTVTDTAYAIATVGSDRTACQSATVGNSTTTGLHFQWEAVSTDYSAGLATLISDPGFSIDGVNANSGSNKFANVAAPIMTGEDCYTVTYVLRASYIPFPNSCFSTDTVSVFYCCLDGGTGCPDPVASQEGTNGFCSNATSLFNVPNVGLDVEWTTYAVDGVLQPAGTEPRGLFSITADTTKSTAVNATGPHPYDVIVDFDDATWGWSGANSVTYNIRYYGTISGVFTECSVEVIVFSGQVSNPVIGVNDLTLCGFPSPGVESGSSGLSTPYTITGANYSQAPNSGFIWTWEELAGGTVSIDANEDTPFPTLSPSATTDYLVTVQDPVTGCTSLDTLTVTVVEIRANAGNDISGVCEGALVQLGSSAQDNHSYVWSPTAGLEEPIGMANSTTARPYLVTPAAPSGIDYAVLVTESTTGCQATDTITITTDTDPPTALSDLTDAACAGGVEFAYFGSAQSGHTYAWTVHSSSAGGDISWLRDPTSTYAIADIPAETAAGVYVFELTKTKGTCGSTSGLYTITVYASPSPDLSADITATCSTPYPQISTTAEAGASYSWTPSTNLFLDDAGTMPITSSLNAAYHTVYVGPVTGDPINYRIRASSGAPGYCSTYDTITVSPASLVAANAGSDANYCPGGSAITIGIADAGTSHAWTAVGYNSDPDGTPATPTAGEGTTMLGYLGATIDNITTFSQSSTAAGVYVYELTSTSVEGCASSDQVTVIVKDIPALVGSTTNTCAGSSVQLGISPTVTGYSFFWSALSPSSESYTIDDQTSPNPNVNPVVNTTYRAIITDQSTGCQTTQIVTVVITESPDIADASSASLCLPMANQDLTALVANYGTLQNPIWYANSIPGTVVTDPTMVLPSQTTDYFLIGENTYGCVDTATIRLIIEQPQTPVISPIVYTNCPIVTIDLVDYQPALSDTAFNFEWHTDNTTNMATLITNTTVGEGTYYLFEISDNGCASGSADLTMSVSSCADLSLAKTVSDARPKIGDTITFTITVANAGPNNATGVAVEDILPIGYSDIHNISNSGVKTVDTIAWSALNVANDGNITLTFDAVVDAPTGATDEYENVAQVTASDQNDPDSSPDNGVDPDNDGLIGTVDTGTNDGSVDTDSDDDSDNEPVIACNYTITARDTSICSGQPIDLSTLIEGTPENTLAYGTDFSFGGTNMVNPLTSTTYFVRDSNTTNMCVDTALIFVKVDSCDWGDLPDVSALTGAGDYQTSDANNGPVHIIDPAITLGSTIDGEIDGQPSMDALGDDTDEDGLVIFENINISPGGTFRLPLSYTNTTGSSAHIEAWIDWNNNGEFDSGEMVLDVTDPSSGLYDQLEVTVPPNAVSGENLGLRIRISNQNNMTPYGLINGGEVEDYLIAIECPTQICVPIKVTIRK